MTNKKFKIGDEVVGTNSKTYTVTCKGWKGKVVDVKAYNEIIVVQLDGKDTSRWSVKAVDFELITEEPKKTVTEFKIGDLVVGNSNSYGITCKGWEGKVVGVRGTNIVVVQADGKDASKFTLPACDFDLLSSTVKSAHKFKVGDEIIGIKHANPYGITNEGWKGVVRALADNGMMEVYALEKSSFSDGPYGVSSDHFELLSEHLVKTSKQNPFKVGDTVIGTSEDYFITCRGWKGRVVEVHDETDISVQDVNPTCTQIHRVRAKYFALTEAIITKGCLDIVEYVQEAKRRGFVDGVRYVGLTAAGTPGETYTFDESIGWTSSGSNTFGKSGLGWLYANGKWAKICPSSANSTVIRGTLPSVVIGIHADFGFSTREIVSANPLADIPTAVDSLQDYCKNLLS